jgi:hypothetical protein
MPNEELPWITLDGNAVGQEPLWEQYAPLFRERLLHHRPYTLAYPNIAGISYRTTQERTLIEDLLKVRAERDGAGFALCFKYALSPRQVETLLRHAWLSDDPAEEPYLRAFLGGILQTLNIALI